MAVFYYPRPRLFRTIVFYIILIGLFFLTYTIVRFGGPYTGYVLFEQIETQYFSSLRLAENSSEPQLVLLLTYQRGGSSFLGEIFNRNPLAWYWFEPLDGAYQASYGTHQGWAIPSDILAYMNGTLREQPAGEVDMVVSVLRNLLTCELNNLPTPVLFHKFMYMGFGLASVETYTKCINYQVPMHDVDICNKYLDDVCPQRFWQDPRQSEICARLLQDSFGTDRLDVSTSYENISNKTIFSVERHLDCLQGVRDRIQPCIEELTSSCQAADLRVIKSIRVTMPSIVSLLEEVPNVKVIQAMRDPRAVAKSRHHHPSYWGMYSEGNLVKEADLYCRNVMLDNAFMLKLRKYYPGSFYQLFYEDLAENPLAEAAGIYDYLQRDFPEVVAQWLVENTQVEVNNHKWTSQNAKEIVAQWRREIPEDLIIAIDDVCDKLYDQLGNKYTRIDAEPPPFFGVG